MNELNKGSQQDPEAVANSVEVTLKELAELEAKSEAASKAAAEAAEGIDSLLNDLFAESPADDQDTDGSAPSTTASAVAMPVVVPEIASQPAPAVVEAPAITTPPAEAPAATPTAAPDTLDIDVAAAQTAQPAAASEAARTEAPTQEKVDTKKLAKERHQKIVTALPDLALSLPRLRKLAADKGDGVAQDYAKQLVDIWKRELGSPTQFWGETPFQKDQATVVAHVKKALARGIDTSIGSAQQTAELNALRAQGTDVINDFAEHVLDGGWKPAPVAEAPAAAAVPEPAVAAAEAVSAATAAPTEAAPAAETTAKKEKGFLKGLLSKIHSSFSKLGNTVKARTEALKSWVSNKFSKEKNQQRQAEADAILAGGTEVAPAQPETEQPVDAVTAYREATLRQLLEQSSLVGQFLTGEMAKTPEVQALWEKLRSEVVAKPADAYHVLTTELHNFIAGVLNIDVDSIPPMINREIGKLATLYVGLTSKETPFNSLTESQRKAKYDSLDDELNAAENKVAQLKQLITTLESANPQDPAQLTAKRAELATAEQELAAAKARFETMNGLQTIEQVQVEKLAGLDIRVDQLGNRYVELKAELPGSNLKTFALDIAMLQLAVQEARDEGAVNGKFTVSMFDDEVGKRLSFDTVRGLGVSDPWNAETELQLVFSEEDLRVLEGFFAKLDTLSPALEYLMGIDLNDMELLLQAGVDRLTANDVTYDQMQPEQQRAFDAATDLKLLLNKVAEQLLISRPVADADVAEIQRLMKELQLGRNADETDRIRQQAELSRVIAEKALADIENSDMPQGAKAWLKDLLNKKPSETIFNLLDKNATQVVIGALGAEALKYGMDINPQTIAIVAAAVLGISGSLEMWSTPLLNRLYKTKQSGETSSGFLKKTLGKAASGVANAVNWLVEKNTRWFAPKVRVLRNLSAGATGISMAESASAMFTGDTLLGHAEHLGDRLFGNTVSQAVPEVTVSGVSGGFGGGETTQAETAEPSGMSVDATGKGNDTADGAAFAQDRDTSTPAVEVTPADSSAGTADTTGEAVVPEVVTYQPIEHAVVVQEGASIQSIVDAEFTVENGYPPEATTPEYKQSVADAMLRANTSFNEVNNVNYADNAAAWAVEGQNAQAGDIVRGDILNAASDEFAMMDADTVTFRYNPDTKQTDVLITREWISDQRGLETPLTASATINADQSMNIRVDQSNQGTVSSVEVPAASAPASEQASEAVPAAAAEAEVPESPAPTTEQGSQAQEQNLSAAAPAEVSQPTIEMPMHMDYEVQPGDTIDSVADRLMEPLPAELQQNDSLRSTIRQALTEVTNQTYAAHNVNFAEGPQAGQPLTADILHAGATPAEFSLDYDTTTGEITVVFDDNWMEEVRGNGVEISGQMKIQVDESGTATVVPDSVVISPKATSEQTQPPEGEQGGDSSGGESAEQINETTPTTSEAQTPDQVRAEALDSLMTQISATHTGEVEKGIQIYLNEMVSDDTLEAFKNNPNYAKTLAAVIDETWTKWEDTARMLNVDPNTTTPTEASGLSPVRRIIVEVIQNGSFENLPEFDLPGGGPNGETLKIGTEEAKGALGYLLNNELLTGADGRGPSDAVAGTNVQYLYGGNYDKYSQYVLNRAPQQ